MLFGMCFVLCRACEQYILLYTFVQSCSFVSTSFVGFNVSTRDVPVVMHQSCQVALTRLFQDSNVLMPDTWVWTPMLCGLPCVWDHLGTNTWFHRHFRWPSIVCRLLGFCFGTCFTSSMCHTFCHLATRIETA